MTNPNSPRATLPVTLLAVFAHPDDEAFSSGGTLAHYAALGVQVYVVSSTRGEMGKITDPELGEVLDVGAFREEELKKACLALGIHPPIFLGYHDSGRGDRLQVNNPLASINADLLELEGKILEVIDRLQPQVLLSFDPHGAYGHPDHLVIQRATLGAFFRSSVPQRLFYTSRSHSDMQNMVERSQAASGNKGVFESLDAKIYGVPDSTIAVTMDVHPYLERKYSAVYAHRSQVGPSSSFASMTKETFEQFLGRETFSIGGSRGAIKNYPLKGFFEGLELGLD
jgi:N-acetyl-1-D-myo-inositol-2-amino-2-deoxy-alpha-D-glucopyranoside deacetylase